jgi:DNA-binding transcriptional regulator YiaG
MTELANAPAITGPIQFRVVCVGTAMGISRTGVEYVELGDYFEFVRLEGWGVQVGESDPGEDDVSRLARQFPFVEREPAALPELTDNLVVDVRALSGLTIQQLADLAGVTERRVHGWRQRPGTIPPAQRNLLNALRAISIMMYRGLGAQGVASWLRTGSPSPLALLGAGQIKKAVGKAERFRETIAT